MTQYTRILRTLQSGRTLTSKQARTWGITNLRARVFELRQQGYDIRTSVENRRGQRVFKYHF